VPYGLVANAAARPERVAIACGERRLTYGDFDRLVNRVAQVLAGHGLRAGGRVALMMANGPEFFAVTQAAGKLAAVAVPVNFHWRETEVAHVLADAAPDVFVTDTAFASVATAARARAGHPGPGAVLVHDAAKAQGSFDVALATAPDATPSAGTHESGFNVLIYTSGTTGRPKGVVHPTFDPAVGFAAQKRMVEMWGFTQDDVHLVVGPAYHTMPNAYATQHLFVGATVVVMPKFDAEECLRLIAAERVTTSSMVPAHFVRILALPEAVRARYDVSSLRKVLHAAAPCPPEVKRRIMAYFPADSVWEFYGATEGPGTIISPAAWRERPGSVGRAWPGVRLRILDDDGNVLGPGRIGSIYLAPPGGGFRYHNAEAQTAAAYREGYFTVGDVGWLDADGYLFIADRKHDMVISGGVNIYPREIEDVLIGHPKVLDVAVIGVPDPEWGEQLKAIIQLKPGETATADEVIAFARQHLADYKRPRTVDFVAELPREPSGKLYKRKLKEQYWAGRDRMV
jgi:long-chain acyl-CoA synthetase